MSDAYDHYVRHKDVYSQIAEELSNVRSLFESSDRFTQKVMLFDSSVFAVTSVQNDISVLRSAFRGYCNADTWDELREIMHGINYGQNKYDYICSNFDTIFGQEGDEIIALLENGHTWSAIEVMVDELQGVSWVKAPFIACMLGYTDVMCIDTNVAQQVPDEQVKASDYSSMSEYQHSVSLVQDHFGRLNMELSPFMLQWVVFDYNRGDGVARHEEWFEQMLPGSKFGRQTMLDSF